MTGRLLIVANRLPLTLVGEDRSVRIEPSTGGLATGLSGPHRDGEGLWFGWPGSLRGLAPSTKAAALQQLAAQRFVPIELRKGEIDAYYNEVSNGVLWPTFHYMVDRIPPVLPDWDAYRAVNERFADTVAAAYRPGDRIWIHDYHLLLLPNLLRQRLPQAQIGFFLHIPFPSSEVFRILPWRAELLQGLLGADLIGFHTLSYLRHFAAALLRILGLEVGIDRVLVGDREVRLTALPMGIDVDGFNTLGDDPAVIAEADELRAQRRGALCVLGIDRLDYTKGLPRRLLAFEQLLATRPPEAPRVQLIQVAATSRGEVGEYQAFKRSVDEMVGRINGRFGTTDFTPIRYVNSSLDARAVAVLYRAADVMMVTPLRDGLNLVAKEFVATRTDGDGVLLLSEFAGAAAELPEALAYNPYDVDGAARRLAQALAMPETDRRRRMRGMRATVQQHGVHRWVATFLEELAATPAPPAAPELGDPLAARTAPTRPLLLCLDYDGTLVDFAGHPDQASPDAALLELLQRLAAHQDRAVHLVSGRPTHFLERWFGTLPIHLHAEHGFASRAPGAAWQMLEDPDSSWRPRVQSLLERIAAHTPGSFVETKDRGIAWHYRMVEPAFAATVAKEVRLHLLELLSNVGVAVVQGNRVLEVRPQGVHKGRVLQRALAEATNHPQVLAIGDDRTDEDLFTAAPPDAITIHVGHGPTAARHRLPDPAAVRTLLERLVAG